MEQMARKQNKTNSIKKRREQTEQISEGRARMKWLMVSMEYPVLFLPSCLSQCSYILLFMICQLYLQIAYNYHTS